jgi:hypothetical protein
MHRNAENAKLPSLGVTSTMAVALISFTALLIKVILSPMHPVYDEQWYLSAVALYQKYGLSVEFVHEQPGPAGPTFSLLHGLLAPVTRLEFPNVRYVNLALLAVCSMFLTRTISDLNPAIPRSHCIAWALSLLAMPLIAVSAGMALTEMPGIAFYCFGLMLLLGISPAKQTLMVEAAIITVVSTAFFFAIMARQSFIAPLAASPILSIAAANDCKNRALLTSVASAALCLPIFMIWKGLVPPLTASFESGFSAWNVLLSFSYLSIPWIILRFDGLKQIRDLRRLAGAGLIWAAGLAAGTLEGRLTGLMPFRTWAEAHLSTWKIQVLSASFVACIAMLGALFLCYMLASIARELRSDPRRAYLFAGVLLLCISNGKITHQFSSRYIVIALPLLLLAERPSLTLAYSARLAIGAGIGFFALNGYYALS